MTQLFSVQFPQIKQARVIVKYNDNNNIFSNKILLGQK